MSELRYKFCFFFIGGNVDRSWGEGCLPLWHLRTLNDAQVVRAFPGSAFTEHNHLTSHASIKVLFT